MSFGTSSPHPLSTSDFVFSEHIRHMQAHTGSMWLFNVVISFFSGLTYVASRKHFHKVLRNMTMSRNYADMVSDFVSYASARITCDALQAGCQLRLIYREYWRSYRAPSVVCLTAVVSRICSHCAMSQTVVSLSTATCVYRTPTVPVRAVCVERSLRWLVGCRRIRFSVVQMLLFKKTDFVDTSKLTFSKL